MRDPENRNSEIYLLFQKNRLVSRLLHHVETRCSTLSKTDTSGARKRWLFGLKKPSQRAREITAKVAASERLRPRTFLAQGAARKHGVSKHGPCSQRSQRAWSVLRGRFAAPQYEVIGVKPMSLQRNKQSREISRFPPDDLSGFRPASRNARFAHETVLSLLLLLSRDKRKRKSCAKAQLSLWND